MKDKRPLGICAKCHKTNIGNELLKVHYCSHSKTGVAKAGSQTTWRIYNPVTAKEFEDIMLIVTESMLTSIKVHQLMRVKMGPKGNA